jgi:mono/diheme cytochrome c family protein
MPLSKAFLIINLYIRILKMKKIYITTLTIFALNSTAFAGVGGFMHGYGDQHWESPASAKKVKNPVNSTRRSVNKGEVLFMNSCASCHGVKANGDGPLAKGLNTEPTNLRAMSGMHPDGDFAWKIANGNGAMPAWKDSIKQKDIWNLVNYIQSLSPNKNTAASMGHSADEHSMMGHDIRTAPKHNDGYGHQSI